MRQTKRAALSLLAWIAIAGCARVYQSPPAHSPHALVRVRVRHRAVLAPHLDERVSLNGQRVVLDPGEASALVRVRPGANELGVHVAYYEEALRPTVAVRDETRTTRCRFDGDDGSTQTGRCTVTVPVAYETVVVDRIDAGGCATSQRFRARAGGRYLLEYDFEGANACRITCRRLERGRAVACE